MERGSSRADRGKGREVHAAIAAKIAKGWKPSLYLTNMSMAYFAQGELLRWQMALSGDGSGNGRGGGHCQEPPRTEFHADRDMGHRISGTQVQHRAGRQPFAGRTAGAALSVQDGKVPAEPKTLRTVF